MVSLGGAAGVAGWRCWCCCQWCWSCLCHNSTYAAGVAGTDINAIAGATGITDASVAGATGAVCVSGAIPVIAGVGATGASIGARYCVDGARFGASTIDQCATLML